MYGSDLDVTNYANGRRVTLNPLLGADGEEEGERVKNINRLIYCSIQMIAIMLLC